MSTDALQVRSDLNSKTYESHHLFGLAEVLHVIFIFLPESCLPAVARVNSLWGDVALSILWKDLDSLFPLLELVEPLVYDTEWGWGFDGESYDGEWDRFNYYSRRVHSIVHDEAEERQDCNSVISPESIIDLLRRFLGTAQHFLLPNVRSITWRAEVDPATWQLIPFLSPHVEFLDIELSATVSPSTACRLLSRISPKEVPRLKSFRFAVDSDFDGNKNIHKALVSFLSRHKSLTNVIIPYLSATGDIVSALSEHTSLRVFDALGDFASAEEFHTFLTSLASTCPQLEEVSLDLWGGFRSAERLRFESIKPLLGSRSLVKLEISHNHSMILRVGDIIAMGRAWPNMERLSLCAEEQRPGRTGTPLNLLSVFAASFPRLRELAHYFTVPSNSLPQANDVTTRFNCLSVLGVGTSVVSGSEIPGVGEYLGAVCPEGLKVVCTRVGSRTPVFGGSDRGAATGKKVWDDVLNVVQMVHRIQSGYAKWLAGASKEALHLN